MDIVLVIILSLLGVGILAFVVYKVLQFMKGSVKVEVPKKKFHTGETISGNISLKLKKQVESNEFRISLIGYATQNRSSVSVNGVGSPSNSQRTTTQEVFRASKVLEGQTNYSSGTSKKFNFEIPVPSKKEVEGYSNNGIANAASNVMKLMSGYRLRWKLETRLDAEGVDLTNTKSIKIYLEDGPTTMNINSQNQEESYNNQMKDYIESNKRQYAREDLRKVLVESGQDEREVERHLNKFY